MKIVYEKSIIKNRILITNENTYYLLMIILKQFSLAKLNNHLKDGYENEIEDYLGKLVVDFFHDHVSEKFILMHIIKYSVDVNIQEVSTPL